MSARKKLDDRSRISAAASLLGGITSPRKRKASAENGRLGGRPCYGVCSVRELRRRIRSFLMVTGSDRIYTPLRDYQILVADALSYRRELIDRMKASGKIGEDEAARLVYSHPLTSTVEGWRRLVLLNPGLL